MGVWHWPCPCCRWGMTYSRLLTVALLTGCIGDDGPQCQYYDTGAPDIAAYELRDPVTGTCQPFGGGYCPDPCTPCPATGQAEPDWAQCFSSCEGLDENTCKSTAACRAVYSGDAFYQCWG